MNTKYFFLMLAMTFTFLSCEDSDEDSPVLLELSQSSFSNISASDETVELNITSDGPWTASSTATWCTVTPKEGNGNQKIRLHLLANLEKNNKDCNGNYLCKRYQQNHSIEPRGEQCFHRRLSL